MRFSFCLSLLAFILFGFLTGPIFSMEVPDYKGYVTDNEGIIENRVELEEKLSKFEELTSIEIAVLTTENFSDTYIEDYASRVFEAWGIGKADKDNGILIIVSSEKRESRIEVGYGLEGDLTDATTGRIQDNFMIPFFREDKYSEGINSGVDAVISVLEGNEIIVDSAIENEEALSGLFSCGIFMAFFLIAIRNEKLAALIGGVIMLLLGSLLFGSVYSGLVAGFVGALIGFLMSLLGKKLPESKSSGSKGSIWRGPVSGGGSSGGGFGGFGGGSSGGGGASRGW